MRYLASRTFIVILLAAGCSSGDSPSVGPDAGDFMPLSAPTIDSLSPTELSLGDKVTVVGSNFPERRQGEMQIQLTGTYLTVDGDEFRFEGRVPLEVENRSVASFDFDELFFSTGADQIGSWKGTAELVVIPRSSDDVAGAGEDLMSDAFNTTFRVKPSIVVDRLRAIDAQEECVEYSKATNENHQLELGFRAIGFGVATEAEPWNFRVQFSAPSIEVTYIKEEAVQDLDDSLFGGSPIDDSVKAAAQGGSNRLDVEVTDGDSILINPTRFKTTADINPPVEIGPDSHERVVLGRIAAGPVEKQWGSSKANMVLEISTKDGRTLRRGVTMEIFQEYELMKWNQVEKPLRRSEAERSYFECIPGGDIGRELQYTEGESKSYNYNVDFRWDQNTASSLGAQFGLFNPVAQITANQTWSETFGVSYTNGKTSEEHRNLNISAHIIPTYFGTCYRQVTEVERSVEIVYHSACGVTGVIGDAWIKEYKFSYDVAVGQQCPPETNLPPAETWE